MLPTAMNVMLNIQSPIQLQPPSFHRNLSMSTQVRFHQCLKPLKKSLPLNSISSFPTSVYPPIEVVTLDTPEPVESPLHWSCSVLAGVGDRLIWTLDDKNLANITWNAEDLVSNKVSKECVIHIMPSSLKDMKRATDKFLRSS